MVEIDDSNEFFNNELEAPLSSIQNNADIMLFGKWSLSDVQVSDISLVVSFFDLIGYFNINFDINFLSYFLGYLKKNEH